MTTRSNTFATPICYVANGEADAKELRSPVLARTNVRTYATNERFQDQGEKGRVSYSPTPVDKCESRVGEVRASHVSGPFEVQQYIDTAVIA